jgi:lysophospholipase L1-like esterase
MASPLTRRLKDANDSKLKQDKSELIKLFFKSYDAFGDSIVAGYAASTINNRWVNKLANFLNCTVTNYGISGSLVADQQIYIYQKVVSDNDNQLFTLQIGTNEGAFYGTASNRQQTFQALHQASLAWLAIPERSKLRGQAAASAAAIISLTSNGAGGVNTLATATTSAPHGFSTGQAVTIAGAAQSAFNVTAPITVTGATTFTYPINGTPTTPATGTITATGPGIVYAGTWAVDNTVLGGNISRKSNTNGATATFKTFGTTIYLAYGMETNDVGSFSVTIDGVIAGTFTSNGVNGGFATTGVVGTTHGSALARFANLTNGPHTVVVTVTSATGTGNVWLDWVQGAGTLTGSQFLSGPTVVAGAAPQQGNGASTSALYGSLAQADVGVLAADGLNVLFADVPGAMNAGTDIISDNTHPNDSGMQHIAEAYYAALSTTARQRSAYLASQASAFLGPILSGAINGNTVTNSGTWNSIVGGGVGGGNTMSGSGNNNTIAGGKANIIGGGGTANTNDNFIGGGASNVAQFGGQNGGVGGTGNVLQGFRNGFVGGRFNYIYGTESALIGGLYGADRSRSGWVGTAAGKFSANGDAQAGYQVLRGTTSGTTLVRLTYDAVTATAANSVGIPDATAYGLRIVVTVRSVTTPANSFVWSLPVGTLLRGTGAGSTTLTLGTPVTTSTGSFAPTVSVTADTTLGALNISVTPPAGNTDTIRAVARVESVEVG